MLYQLPSNIIFHNVDDIKYYPDLGGIALFRFPMRIRNTKNGSAWNSTGCEIRFQTNEECVYIMLNSLDTDGQAMILKNNCPLETVHIQRGIVRRIALRSDGACTNWRVLFGKGYTAVFGGLDHKGIISKHPPVCQKTMLAYGSSITHGSGADFIDSSYIHMLSRKLDYDLLNKGISGMCFCDEGEVDFIIQKDVDLFFCELGINMIGKFGFADYERIMRTTAHKLKASRKKTIMVFFKEILDTFSQKSSIPYNVRTYAQFQSDPFFREGLIKILDNYTYFSQLLNPSSNRLHVRIKCPVCNKYDKTSKNMIISKQEDGGYILESCCEEHGYYSINLMADNIEYVDVNTQLRDLLKGYMINQEQNTVTIMMDGSDWGGTWSNRIHCEGLVALGEKNLPIRVFTPMILDWSGAKFSKSLYMKLNDYENINQAFNDYRVFKKKYSAQGINLVWELACQWVNEPKRFFRNYSIAYFDLFFKESEGTENE